MKIITVRVIALVALVLMVTIPSRLMAQWNTNTFVNLPISNLLTADMQAVSTTDGKTWIAFYHENSGNYDMRAQLIDEDGYKLLGPDGVLVSNQSSGTATFVFNAAVDASNNLIIGCQDERTGTMQAVLYKISQAGTHLWSPNGVILGAGMVPYPATLSNGETAVCWNDDASSSLKLQKITNAGSLAWATPVTLMVGSSTVTRGQIVGNLNEKFTIVYQKYAGGISTNLYAQMFSSSGTALYAPLQIASQTTAPYRYYSILADGDTTYFGYYASPGLRFNSFLQRINPGGSIPWGMNGSNFNTSTSGSDNYQMETSIDMDPGSNYVWAVSSFCDPNQTNYGIYVQKFLKTSGARQLTDQGKLVYAISPSRYIQAGNLAVIDNTPMFMFYDASYKIYATRLDASGNFAWAGNQVEISSTTAGAGNPKGRYCFTPDGPNRCAGTWTENRGSGEMGYAQGISIGGLIGIDVTTQGSVPATITTGGGSLQLVAAIYPSTASQSVNWSIIPVSGLASINSSGLVTAQTDGTVWAKAAAVADETMADSILITISNQIPIPPAVVTLAATNITLTDARLNGSVNANNYSSNVSFEWGLTASYGNIVSASPVQVTGNTSVPVLANLGSLASGTTYHFRCFAVNAGGTTYGQDQSFTTLCQMAGTMSAITGTNNLCAGTTGVVYSVTPFPGAIGYIWTVPQGATIVAGNNTNVITVDFSPTAISGDMSVYATDGLCTSIPSPSLTINVTPLPVQAGNISGLQELCEGTTGVQYSITPIPGVTSYTWTVPTGAVITAGQNTTTITVNFPVGCLPGNITVYGANDCGTGATSAPLPITLIPLPATAGVIEGPDHICAEASNIQYSIDPLTNAFGYVWSFPLGVEITSGNNTNLVTVHFTTSAVSGNITVYGTNGNCLGETSPALAVTVDPIPSTPVVTLQGFVLTSSAPEGNQWYKDGNLIPGATLQQYVVTENGEYTVIVTLNGCSSAPSNGVIVLTSVGESNIINGFNVFPNPSTGVCNVKIPSKLQQDYSIEIYNYLGKLILRKANESNIANSEEQLDLSDLPSGTYMLILKQQKETLVGKLYLSR
jgi:hypothetical protein